VLAVVNVGFRRGRGLRGLPFATIDRDGVHAANAAVEDVVPVGQLEERLVAVIDFADAPSV
jgi:hypothetical protein